MSARQESRPRSRRSRTRRLLLVLVVLALAASAALAAAWVWVESPSGQDRIRRGLEARGTSLLGRAVRIGALELDLLPFNATLTGIEIDGVAGSDQPLFAAAAARVRVRAWALLSRELRISELDIDTPVVHWDAAEGPGPALDAGGGSRLALVIDRLSLVDGSLELNHRRWNLDTSLIDVSLGLQPVEGATGADRRRNGVLQIRGGGVRIEPDTAEPRGLRGALNFVGAEVPFTLDEDLLRIDEARIGIGRSELVANGQISEWRSGELSLDGRLDLRDLMALSGVARVDPTVGLDDVESADPTVAVNEIESGATDGGDITLASTLTFGTDPFRFAGTLISPSLTIAGIAATDFSAEVRATADEVLVDAARASLFEGDVSARIGVDLTAVPRAWRLEYEAGGVDLAELTTSAALPGFRFAGIGAGTATLSWSDPMRETISGAGSFDLSLPSDTLARLAGSVAPALDVPLPDEATRGTGVAFDDTTTSGATSQQQAAPSLPLPVEAHAEYSLESGNLLLQNTSVSLPRTTAELEGAVRRDGSIAGRISLRSDDLRIPDRFFTQIRRFRGELPVPQPLGIVGRGIITASVAGTLEAPSADGTLEARALAVADNPVGDVDGSLRLAGAALEILDLRLERGGGHAEGEGRFRIGQRTTQDQDYAVGLRLERFPMAVELPRLGVPLSVAGETTGELELTGAYGSSPSGEVTLHGESVRLNDLSDLSAEVSIRLNPEQWVADRFEIAGPRGRLTASGAWRRADDTLQAYIEGVDIDASIVSDLRGTELPVAGTVRLEAQLTGPFAEPNAAATVRWTDAAAYGVNLGSVASSAELRGRSVAIAAVGRSDPTSSAVPPPTPAALGGAIAVPLPMLPDAGWVATLSTDLEAPNLATLRAAGESSLVLALLAAQGYDPGEDLQVRGAVQVSGSGSLGDWRGWTGSAVIAGFALSRPGLTFAIPEPMTLELVNRECKGLMVFQPPLLCCPENFCQIDQKVENFSHMQLYGWKRTIILRKRLYLLVDRWRKCIQENDGYIEK